MTALNPTANYLPRQRRAASLSEAVRWQARRVWDAAESYGYRRAAPELARIAHSLAERDPALASRLMSTARLWASR